MSHPAWVCGLKRDYYKWSSKQKQSHPAWVCGLKLSTVLEIILSEVTPCVGVWIETIFVPQVDAANWSHPAWVCGLKHYVKLYN